MMPTKKTLNFVNAVSLLDNSDVCYKYIYIFLLDISLDSFKNYLIKKKKNRYDLKYHSVKLLMSFMRQSKMQTGLNTHRSD